MALLARFAACAALAVAGPAMADEQEAEGTVTYTAYPESFPANASGNVSTSPCRKMTDDWPSPFTNRVCWSDGLEPHRGPTYVAGSIDGAASLLWTPIQSADTAYDMFKTLELKDASILFIRHQSRKSATFEELRITGTGGEIWGPDVDTTIIRGKLSVADSATLFVRTYNNRRIWVDSELSGSGNVSFRSQTGTTAYSGSYALYGINTNFYGLISINSGAGKDATLASKFSTLTITNALSLGGNLTEFTYNALQLLNKSKLNVTAKDVVLSADANRGIQVVSGDGRIGVPESAGTLTVNWPITIANGCHLYKEGPGRLVFGSQLRFTNKNGTYINTTKGSGCSYYIDIREGEVAVTDCQAFDGAYVAFSNDTALVVSAVPANSDLQMYGLRLDKTTAPLTTDLPIRIEAPEGGLANGAYEVPLLTVKAVDREEVAEKLSVTSAIRGYKLEGVTYTTSGTSVTFKTRLVRKGFVVYFK